MRHSARPHRHAIIALCSLAVVAMSCGGGSPASPSSPSASTTFLSLVSVPGDQIGNGFTQRVGLSEAIFWVRFIPGVSGDMRQLVDIRIAPRNGSSAWWWTLVLAAPEGKPLQAGTYEGAKRYGTQRPTEAGMDFSGTGLGCTFLTGRFVIDELVLGASDSYYINIDRMHLSFEQRCDTASASIRGEISIVANPWR